VPPHDHIDIFLLNLTPHLPVYNSMQLVLADETFLVEPPMIQQFYYILTILEYLSKFLLHHPSLGPFILKR
jgi:hypothetical protein